MSAPRAVLLTAALVFVLTSCGREDPLNSAAVDDGPRCESVFDLVARPLDADLADRAASLAESDEERRAFQWQAEFARLTLAGSLTTPDWAALGFDAEPSLDDITSVLEAAAENCAGVS